MASEKEDFSLSGSVHLTRINWTNADHQRAVAACLVQGVYILERDRQKKCDRQKKREDLRALDPRWWKSFHFNLLCPLYDDADNSIFGAIYEYEPPSSHASDSIKQSPRHVIAFRGTLIKLGSVSRDFELDIRIILNELHKTSRFEIGMQAVRNMVAAVGDSNVWLAGHSSGAAIAMLAGKTMARAGLLLESFLFNPPFPSAPIERIEDAMVRHGIRFFSSVAKAALARAVKPKNQNQAYVSKDQFAALSAWSPCLFVNPSDHICSEYIGYFQHRRTMEKIRLQWIEDLATRHSLRVLLRIVVCQGSEAAEPFHLIPSANLTINKAPTEGFRNAHGIRQWWRRRPDLDLHSRLYTYR